MLPKKLAIGVTFHFVEERLQYLNMITDHFSQLAEEVKVVVVTNLSDEDNLAKITKTISNKGFEFSFLVPTGLGHPFLLTWSHFAAFREWVKDETITHFMYVEDDILVTRTNMEYWMMGREELREYGFIPSFLRVEKRGGDDRWYSSDCLRQHKAASLPRVRVSDCRVYFSLPTPYQGMYLLDRELMLEHLNSSSSIPEYGNWGIREKAARGVTFNKVRKGFHSRNLIPVTRRTRNIDEACLIHHTPNNYANDLARTDGLGSVLVNELILL